MDWAAVWPKWMSNDIESNAVFAGVPMDLSEVRLGVAQRHPWETARADAIERILGARAIRPATILDVGCGDGFTGEQLASAFGAAELWGVDLHATAESCARQSRSGVHYVQHLEQVPSKEFALALLCDVIEHVQDDVGLVESALSRLAPDGHLLLTVPSFQALFSSHDRALRHYRRYSLPELRRTIDAAGADSLADGYLFGSLLPVRVMAKLKEQLFPRDEREGFGVGGWSAPPLVTSALRQIFRVDNRLMLGLSSGSIKPPGLSAWALCKKRR
jgi:2-polyprenyl-3-methyl-5-hydroxy-6-metoxy-1,4-benzoquinol methylase